MPTFFLLDNKVHIFSRVTETSENWREKSTHRYKIMSTISGSSTDPGQELSPKEKLAAPACQAMCTNGTGAGQGWR